VFQKEIFLGAQRCVHVRRHISESKYENVNLIKANYEEDTDLEHLSLKCSHYNWRGCGIKNYTMITNAARKCFMHNLEQIDMFFKGCYFKHLKQKSITDFFKKVIYR